MAEFLINTLGFPGWLAWSATAGVAAFLILNVIAGGALVFIWAERKIAARIQDRLGPTRTGGRFGWLAKIAKHAKWLRVQHCPTATRGRPPCAAASDCRTTPAQADPRAASTASRGLLVAWLGPF